jgi:hypothetical protein
VGLEFSVGSGVGPQETLSANMAMADTERKQMHFFFISFLLKIYLIFDYTMFQPGIFINHCRILQPHFFDRQLICSNQADL